MFLYLFSFTSVWAEVERRQIIFAVLDKVEEKINSQSSSADADHQQREIAILEALKKAEELLRKKSTKQPTTFAKAKIEPLRLAPPRSFLSDFYLNSPLLTLISNSPGFTSLKFYDSYNPFQEETFFSSGEDKRLKFGTKTWFTDGSLKWVTSTATTRSKLSYPNDGLMHILSAEYRILPWLSIDCNGGLGENDGEGEDIDWYPTITPNEFQKTGHDSDGRVYFYGANLYFRPIALKDLELRLFPSPFAPAINEFNLDIFGGYQFYKASYKMTSGEWKTYSWTPVTGSFSLDSSYKIIHKGSRVGLRSFLGYDNGFSLEMRIAYLPGLKTKGIGWWNNRILDFVQSGGHGHGLDGEVCISYNSPEEIPGLSVGAGFRYAYLVNHGGTSHSDEEGVAPWEMNWDEARSVLKGPFIDVTYLW